MDLQLNGRRALVTGGSRGIGLAAATALAAEGASVCIAARGRARLDEAAAALRAAAPDVTVLAVTVDTGDGGSVAAAVGEAAAGLGGIDILVNCAAKPAGQAAPPALEEITDEVFWADVNVKVLGYLRCARQVAPYMKEAGWGRIVNVSGLAARQTGSIVGSIRNVSVAALTKNLADELGPHGINVTVVHPAITRTEKTPGVVAARAEASGRAPGEVEAGMAAGVTIGRLVTAAEVADVVAFLASPRSVGINGDAVAVGGGAAGAIHY